MTYPPNYAQLYTYNEKAKFKSMIFLVLQQSSNYLVFLQLQCKLWTEYKSRLNKGSRKKNLVVGPLRAIIAKNKLVFHKKKGKEQSNLSNGKDRQKNEQTGSNTKSNKRVQTEKK